MDRNGSNVPAQGVRAPAPWYSPPRCRGCRCWAGRPLINAAAQGVAPHGLDDTVAVLPAMNPGPTPITSGGVGEQVPRLRLARMASTTTSGFKPFYRPALRVGQHQDFSRLQGPPAWSALSQRQAASPSTSQFLVHMAWQKAAFQRTAVGCSRSVMATGKPLRAAASRCRRQCPRHPESESARRFSFPYGSPGPGCPFASVCPQCGPSVLQSRWCIPLVQYHQGPAPEIRRPPAPAAAGRPSDLR